MLWFDPRTWNDGAKLVGGVVATAAALILVLFILWFVTEPAREHAKAVQAQAAAIDQKNRQKAGQDALKIVTDQARAEGAADAQSQESSDAIHSTAGANVPVDPALNRAGLRALCLRNVYRDKPACKQLR